MFDASFRQSGGISSPLFFNQQIHKLSTPNLHKQKLFKLNVFGRTDIFCDKEFPTLDELSNFTHGKDIKLKKIYYKNGFSNPLKAIKLEFTYGVSSPLFQVDDSNHKLQSIEIDTTRTVRKVQMNIYEPMNQLRGIRLVD